MVQRCDSSFYLAEMDKASERGRKQENSASVGNCKHAEAPNCLRTETHAENKIMQSVLQQVLDDGEDELEEEQQQHLPPQIDGFNGDAGGGDGDGDVGAACAVEKV